MATVETKTGAQSPGAPARETPERTFPRTDQPHRGNGVTERGLVDLLKELRDEASALIENEIDLAKTEIGEKVEQARNGAISMASGGLVLFSGLILTLMGAAAGLYTAFRMMEMDAFLAGWLAPLTIGVVTLIIGAIMVAVGKKKMEPDNLRPSRTERSLRETKSWAERKV